MTIGAIAAAIGLIIDDAIIVVEQIHRTHEEYPDGTQRTGGESHSISLPFHGKFVAQYHCYSDSV